MLMFPIRGGGTAHAQNTLQPTVEEHTGIVCLVLLFSCDNRGYI